MRAIILLLAAALCCGSAHAAVPHEINYQGYLTDPGGAPVNATVQMVFSLYDTATGGTALHSCFRLSAGSADSRRYHHCRRDSASRHCSRRIRGWHFPSGAWAGGRSDSGGCRR